MSWFQSQEPQDRENGGLGPPPDIFDFRNRNFKLPSGIMRWLLPIAFLIILFIVLNILKGIYADWLWFDGVLRSDGEDYLSVFRLRIVTRVWLFFAGAGVFLAFFGVSILAAFRFSSQQDGDVPSLFGDMEPAAARRIVGLVVVVFALFLAVIFGAQAAGQWDNMLLFLNSQDFGVEEPALNQDIGFYVFELPMLNFIVGWSLGVVVLTILGVGAVYIVRILAGQFASEVPASARAHVALLLVVLLSLFIWRYWLSRFGLVFSDSGTTFGASFTDINARLPMIYVLMGFGSLTALLILVSIFQRRLLFLPIGSAVIWVVAAIVGGQIYPATVQRFNVDPNELAKEGEFIGRNIEATRAAYGLDQVIEQDFQARASGVTAAEIAANPETIENIRLWDHRPLLQTLNSLQALRPRYTFRGVDVDRYLIDGEVRQVMLSARELDPGRLPVDAQSWVNKRLQFTHGFGLALLPVNEVGQEGQPNFFVKDIPPVGKLDIEQPRVYFGELPDHYVIVNSEEDEFDFPIGENERAQNRYVDDGGTGGVKLSNILRRITYAWEFGDTNILISGAINSESLLLYRRNIRDRVNEIAPFLLLDGDPYLVVADGGMVWMLDAYTHTDNYPYSTRTAGLNYIRNSVKVVVNAFNGEVNFYLVDPDDPIARVYDDIYPDLFTQFDDMPSSIRAHIRYPLDLFEVQSRLYATYHITDIGTFFNREAVWDIPTELVEQNSEVVMEPYYVIMRLPGDLGEDEEFVLIRPFRLSNRENTIAWLAARSDEPNFGQLILIQFPSDTLVFGPSQVEARIDQNTAISAQFSLWNQGGSTVRRGNLLMIPIGQGNLFVEPIYLEATTGSLPELKRVIVANGNNIAMERTLEEALRVVLGLAEATLPEPIPGEPTPGATATPAPGETPPPTPVPQPTPTPGGDDIDALIQQANDSFERAQQLLQQGDFAGYGQEIERLEELLQRLAELSDLGQ